MHWNAVHLGVHIRFCGHGYWRFRSYSDSLLQTPKRKQNALPLHSVPRLGSACRNEGIAPGARRHRPSMAGGGYRGILAAVPPAQRLRSASGKGAADLKPKQSNSNGKIKRSQPRFTRQLLQGGGGVRMLLTTQ